MELQHGNILLRDATKADAKQLAEWWNDGAVMAHAGFPNGLGTTEEEVAEDIGDGAQTKDKHDNWADLYFYGLLKDDWRKINDRTK